MKHFSMFAGVGGFELGIGDKSECVGFSEIDKYASHVLKFNYPNTTNYGDCKKIKWSEVPDFDMLVGGSPCQDFSIAGKRKGIVGERSGLVWEFIRCLEEKKPKYFIWENVKGVMSSRGGFDFANILTAFSEAGYSLWWQVLNAKDFGVPQNRERIFVCGFRDGCPPEVFFERGTDTKDISDTQSVADYRNDEGLRVRKEFISPNLTSRRHSETDISTMPPMIVRGRPKMPYKLGERTLEYKQYKDECPTLTENCSAGDQKNMVIMNMHTSARNPNRNNAHRGGSGPLLSKDKSFTIETGQPHYVIETDKNK